MIKAYYKKDYTRILFSVSLVLIVVSILVHQTGSFIVYRGLRAVACFSFLGLLVFYKKGSLTWPIPMFLFLYGVSSLTTIWYENKVIASVALLLNFFSFMVLIGALSPKINFKKMNIIFAIIFIILVLVNAYLLYNFVEMLRDFALGDLHYFLMMLGAMTLVITGFLSLLYNHKFSSKSSLLFTSAIFVFIFSEVFRAMGYYNIDYGNISVYIARILILVAMSLLVHFELSEKKPNEILGNK